jgi:predicted nucleic acid-binding protein
VLFDASVYIRALRQGDDRLLQTRNVLHGSLVWRSAVVLEELYAGSDARGRRRFAQFERDFDKVNRLLVPLQSDWTRTGLILSKIGEKYGYNKIGRARLTNDALIGTSAARRGIKVPSVNERDFALIAEFCPLQWDLW